MNFKAKLIHDFWFAGSHLSPEGYEARRNIWFTFDQAFDLEIATRFTSQIVVAAELAEKSFHHDPTENLTRIIATDQFPRNIYRGTPKAFQYDSVALGITQSMIESGMHEKLSFTERLFVYMPLQHAEDIEVQLQSIQVFADLAKHADHPIYQSGGKESLEYAILHKDIIERFGRFPHRNDILGRQSTAEELEYLASGPETFGQEKK